MVPLLHTSLYDRVVAFLERFGEKGLLVLKAAYDISQDPNVDHRLGDFSYKHLVLRLASMGLQYNPVNLLRVLEKEYNIIEKSYTSSNQTWWRFTDIESIKRALSEHYNIEADDPKVRALLIKYKSLEPAIILDRLRRLLVKDKITSSDKEAFKEFVFSELDKITSLIYEMEKYEELFRGELATLREILAMADLVSSRLNKTFEHADHSSLDLPFTAYVQGRRPVKH